MNMHDKTPDDIQKALDELKIEMQDCLDNFISSEETTYAQNFPIESENNLGKWKITETGECFVHPKESPANINLTIKPTGEAHE